VVIALGTNTFGVVVEVGKLPQKGDKIYLTEDNLLRGSGFGAGMLDVTVTVGERGEVDLEITLPDGERIAVPWFGLHYRSRS
jgi:hypothetical protein